MSIETILSSSLITTIILVLERIGTKIIDKLSAKSEKKLAQKSEFEKRIESRIDSMTQLITMSHKKELKELCRKYILDNQIGYQAKSDLLDIYNIYVKVVDEDDLKNDIEAIKALKIVPD